MEGNNHCDVIVMANQSPDRHFDVGLGSKSIKAVIANKFKELNEAILEELKEKHDSND